MYKSNIVTYNSSFIYFTRLHSRPQHPNNVPPQPQERWRPITPQLRAKRTPPPAQKFNDKTQTTKKLPTIHQTPKEIHLYKSALCQQTRGGVKKVNFFFGTLINICYFCMNQTALGQHIATAKCTIFMRHHFNNLVHKTLYMYRGAEGMSIAEQKTGENNR